MLKLFRGFFILCAFLLLIGVIRWTANGPFSYKAKKELNIFTYSDFLDADMIEAFEKESGIHVRLHYFSTNEELLAKLQLAEHKSYDLLFLTDYASSVLANKGDLRPIDRSKINIYDTIYPFLLNKPYDPENIYSIPYMWECSGIAYNNTVIQKEDVGLNLLFDSPYKIVTTGDPIETVGLALYHLFQDKKEISQADEEKIAQCLKKQNGHVEAYAEFRAKDLVLGGNVPVALLKTPYMKDLSKKNPSISFALPKEAIFTSIENVVMLKEAKNPEGAYQFLRFIFEPKNLAKTVERFPMFPASPLAFDHLEEDAEFLGAIEEVKRREKEMRFYSYKIDKEKAHKLYIEAKS